MGEYAKYGFDQQGWYGMFVACGIWCFANGKTSLFDPHKFITNYLNTDLPTIPQSAPTKG